MKKRKNAPQRNDQQKIIWLWLPDKWRAKDYDVALQNVYAGLALEPEDIRIQATLVHRKANNFMGMGSYEQAEKFFKEAMNIDPSFSGPNNNLGVLYEKQGKDKEAEVEYKKALELDPDHEKAKRRLERVLKKLDN